MNKAQSIYSFGLETEIRECLTKKIKIFFVFQLKISLEISQYQVKNKLSIIL